MSEAMEQLIRRGFQARRERRPDEALRCFGDAVELARGGGSPSELVTALKGLGQIERDQGNLAAALAHYQEATGICRTLQDPLMLAHTIRHVADIYRNQGDLEPADQCYREALDIYRTHEGTDRLDLANAIRGFALTKTAEAAKFWAEAKDLYAAANVDAGVQECSDRLARLSS